MANPSLTASVIGKKVFLLVVILLNFWIWRILQQDIFIAVMLIILTFLLLHLFVGKRLKLLTFLFTALLFCLLSRLILNVGYDKTIQTRTPEELVRLDQRHLYYSSELGKLFLNKLVLNYYKNYNLTVNKFENNLFSNLDLNLYFFASHPKERPGVDEFEKISPIFLPLFITGVVLLLYWRSRWAGIYVISASFVSAFVTPNYRLGPILFFPFIHVTIALGGIYLFSLLKQKTHEN